VEHADKGFAISRDLRINQMIRVYDLRVVDEDGSQLGVMRTADALRLAQERGLDLVEVAPLASPPVARLLDFGQYKYELTKREKEAKRRQRSVTFRKCGRRRSALATSRRRSGGPSSFCWKATGRFGPVPRPELITRRSDGTCSTGLRSWSRTRCGREAAAAGRQIDAHQAGLGTKPKSHEPAGKTKIDGEATAEDVAQATTELRDGTGSAGGEGTDKDARAAVPKKPRRRQRRTWRSGEAGSLQIGRSRRGAD
jgi:hypothetical protein